MKLGDISILNNSLNQYVDNDKNTIVHKIVKYAQMESLLKKILSRCEFDLSSPNIHQQTALHIAVTNDVEEYDQVIFGSYKQRSS
jgi:hypothetical protein